MADSQSTSDLECTAARFLCVGFHGKSVSAELAELIRRGVRSVILFERNAGHRDEVAALIREVKSLSPDPIMVCVDQEGGDTVRLRNGFNPPPSMRSIGNDGRARAAEIGVKLAEDLRSVGVDLNLAPVVDVDTNPDNPVIGNRSFGRDPTAVGVSGAALIRAMQAGGVASCAKHFPGHGDTDQDSHFALPILSHGLDRLRSVELVPFQAAIRAGVAAIMTAHIRFDAVDASVPATLSRSIINGILREELGFQGVVISDDLEMQGISDSYTTSQASLHAVQAGVDMVLCCHSFDRQMESLSALASAIENGSISRELVTQSQERMKLLFDQFVRV